MSSLSDGTTGGNKYKPYIEAMKDAGISADVWKTFVIAGYRGKTFVFDIGVPPTNVKFKTDWFGEIVEVTTPSEAVSKVRSL